MYTRITQQLSQDQIGDLYGVRATPQPPDRKPRYNGAPGQGFSAFRLRRYLLPADGWFEWQQRGRRKQPYYLALADGSPLSLAALWERWDRSGAPIETFTIITTATSPGLEDIHHRQPAIIDPCWLTEWLDPQTPLPALLEMARQPHDGPFVKRPVSPRVNSVRNDDPDILLPVSESELF